MLATRQVVVAGEYTHVFNPQLADDDVVNTAVDVLPGVSFVEPETKHTAQ